MGLNFVVPVNLLFEVVILAIQSYAMSFHQDTIDAVFLGVVATYFLFSIVWLFYFKKRARKFLREIRIFRGLQGLLLVTVSGILIFASKPIENRRECLKIESSLGIECHRYAPKLITGILALLNSFIYFFNPCRNVSDTNNNMIGDNPPQTQNKQDRSQSRSQIFGYNIGRFRSRPRSSSTPNVWQDNPYFQHNPSTFYQQRRSINVNYPHGQNGYNKYNVYMPFGSRKPRDERPSITSTAATGTEPRPAIMRGSMIPHVQPKRHNSYVGDGLELGLGEMPNCDKCQTRERF